MKHTHQSTIAKELGINASQVQAVAVLLEEGGNDSVYRPISKGSDRGRWSPKFGQCAKL